MAPAPFRPRTAADWDAVCSPVRLELIQLLESHGPQSVPELAARLGRSPEGLYHHVRLLDSVGLVEAGDEVRRGRRAERRFRLRGPVDLAPATRTKDGAALREGLGRLAGSLLRGARRTFERYVDAAVPDRNAPAPDLTLRSESGHLSPEAAREVREHLDAVRAIFERERDDASGTLHHALWLFHPSNPKD